MRALNAGSELHLAKPLEPADLIKAVAAPFRHSNGAADPHHGGIITRDGAANPPSGTGSPRRAADREAGGRPLSTID